MLERRNYNARKEINKKIWRIADTITPLDYADWRGIGENKAREIFNSKGFPKLRGVGNKQIADKRAVFLHEMGLDNEDRTVILKEMARQII